MLQQTTVAAVVPFFARFLAAFPTIEALAAADEQHVLKLWEGLGYYRRARHLHASAKQLVVEFAGVLPNDPEAWAALPGVGRYILGAVLSQAFDRKLPIVEANSLRVLARFFGYRGDPREGEGKKWVWDAAEAMLPSKRVGDFNQAMMELGATVCTITSPRCAECPLSSHCVAKREQSQNKIPPPKKPKEVIRVREVAVVIRERGTILLCRRPATAGRWQNMWEVPHAEMLPGDDVLEAARRIGSELTGLKLAIGEELLTIEHTVTRYSIAMTCLEASRIRGKFRSDFYAEATWLTPEQLGEYPVSSPQRKLMTAISEKRLF